MFSIPALNRTETPELKNSLNVYPMLRDLRRMKSALSSHWLDSMMDRVVPLKWLGMLVFWFSGVHIFSNPSFDVINRASLIMEDIPWRVTFSRSAPTAPWMKREKSNAFQERVLFQPKVTSGKAFPIILWSALSYSPSSLTSRNLLSPGFWPYRAASAASSVPQIPSHSNPQMEPIGSPTCSTAMLKVLSPPKRPPGNNLSSPPRSTTSFLMYPTLIFDSHRKSVCRTGMAVISSSTPLLSTRPTLSSTVPPPI